MTTESDVRASVCMAAYNGAAHIEVQIRSILEQLCSYDELIIIDDCSTDDTASIIRNITDPRIRLIISDNNLGYVRTFERSLEEARGKYLLLSDQDDVWTQGRLEAMIEALGQRQVVATNLATLGQGTTLRGPFGQDDWRLRPEDSDREFRSIIGILAGNRPYYGCAMGLRRDALDVALPFPPFLIESHDLWLALVGNISKDILHLDLRSLERRLHENNQTPTRPRGAIPALRSRWMLIRSIVEIHRRQRRRVQKVRRLPTKSVARQDTDRT